MEARIQSGFKALRHLLPCAVFFMALSCVPRDEQRVAYVEALVIDFADDEILSINELYRRVTSAEDQFVMSPLDLDVIERNHRLNRTFFKRLDSLAQGSGDELDENTKQALIRESQMISQRLFSALPEPIIPGIVKENFPILRNTTVPMLFVSSMKIQLARLELTILSTLMDRRAVSGHVQDGGRVITARTFYQNADSHSFSLHSEYLQRYRPREIFVDTVMRNNERILPHTRITDEDLLYTVELKSLSPGEYRVTGGNAPKDFQYTFRIR